jgi:hypothetical protein
VVIAKTPFGTRARSIEEDKFHPDYNNTYKGALMDKEKGDHIDPKTGLLKVEFETKEIIYRNWRKYGILPGYITGPFEVFAAGPTPEGICAIVPYIARERDIPFLRTSDVGVRNGVDVVHRLGNGGPAVHVYRTTNLEGREVIIDSKDPVWDVLACEHEQTGKRVYAGVEGADLSYFDNTYERYDDIAQFAYANLRRIRPESLEGWLMCYGAESAAESLEDLQFMFSQLIYSLKPARSKNPRESGEKLHPFAAILTKKGEGYPSAKGTDHTQYPIDEDSLYEMMKDFPIHFDIEATVHSFRPDHDGAIVLTGYALNRD